MDFQKTFDLLSEQVVIIGPSGLILEINASAKSFFNSPGARGGSWKKIVSPYLQPPSATVPLDDMDALLDGALERQGSATLTKDGVETTVRFRVARIAQKGDDAFSLVMSASPAPSAEKPMPSPRPGAVSANELNHLHAINRAQTLYIAKTDPSIVFSELLESLLPITGSEYGFIGEVAHEKETSKPYLRILAVSSSVWNEGMIALHESMVSRTLEFRRLDTLIGHIMTEGKTVISNSISSDPRSGGLPGGHVNIESFMGVPIYTGDRLTGVLGLANRRGGYDQAMEDEMKSFLKACSVIFESVEGAKSRESLEKALIKSEKELRLLIDSLPSLIAYVDSDERYRVANKVYKEWFGIDPETIKGKKVVEVVGEANYAKIQNHIKKALSGRKATHESSFDMAGGSQTHVEGTFVPEIGEDGVVKGYFVLVNDVTEHKIAEEALRRAEAKWRSLVENAADMILLLDVEGDILFINHAPAGLAAEEAVGTNVCNHVSPDHCRTVMDALTRSLDTGDPVCFEMQAKGPFHSLYWYSTVVSPIKDGESEPIFIMITRDISDSKRVEGELRQTADQLREMDAFKNKMISIISHDLRSPITSNIGLLRLLLKTGKDPLSLRQQQIVETMERSNTLLLALVENLLELSKLRRGLVAIHARPISSSEIIEMSGLMLRQMAADKDIQIVEETAPDAWLNADREKMVQALNNLISNSIKFSHPGGVITISSQSEGDETVMTVKDSGVGVEPSEIPSLFDLSRKTTTLGTQGEKGGGLGLAICREITELSGGQMEMDSKPGVGTTVRLKFKRVEVPVETQ
ncbi:MAG: PAS domain S-box protein [Nitrospinae bacterium]|nr:PAS domain S-box protein [Nitrospinota bacterium]